MPYNQRSFKMHLYQAKLSFENGVATQDARARKPAFDAVLFECARAQRIARDDTDAVRALGIDVNEFRDFMKDVAQHRNVAEHWTDVIDPRHTKSHQHTSRAGLKIAVDETSLIYIGPEEVYVGKLNLHDVYMYVVTKLEQIESAGRPRA